MRRQIAALVSTMMLPACSMVPYYTEAKAIADTGIATAVKDRREFNDQKLALNLAALCDSSIGAVNRYPNVDVRDFIDQLCGGDGEGISASRLNEMLRTLNQLNTGGS